MNSVSGEELNLFAGAASVDITPGEGVPLGGYGAPPRRLLSYRAIPTYVDIILNGCTTSDRSEGTRIFAANRGVRDRLTAKALVLDNGKTRAGLIKIDLIAISRRIRKDLEVTAAALGIPAENLMVAATHTHSGPGAISEQKIWQLAGMGCLNEDTYKNLIKGARQALTAATQDLRRAKLGIGVTEERRVSENRAGKKGKIDPQLGLIKLVDRETEKPLAAVINFAVHGTCYGASNMLFSADLMGRAEGCVESEIGGGVAIFFNGAEGDVGPILSGKAAASVLGERLAETAVNLWKTLPTEPWIEMVGLSLEVEMPQPSFDVCSALFGGRSAFCDLIPPISTVPLGSLLQDKYPFAALRLGNVVLAALPGEATTEIGLAVRAAGKMRGYRHTLVVGLANGYMAYITTAPEFYEGRYESQFTLFGQESGLIAVQTLEAIMEAIKPESDSSNDSLGQIARYDPVHSCSGCVVQQAAAGTDE